MLAFVASEGRWADSPGYFNVRAFESSWPAAVKTYEKDRDTGGTGGVRALAFFKLHQKDRKALDAYEQFFESVMQSGVSRQVWTNALLDEIDEAYTLHVHPHRDVLGHWADEAWVQAIRQYWDAVESICWRSWQQHIVTVNKTSTNDIDALRRAPEKLRWVRYLTTNGWTFMMPLPTKSMIADVRDVVLAIDKGIFLVSSRS